MERFLDFILVAIFAVIASKGDERIYDRLKAPRTGLSGWRLSIQKYAPMGVFPCKILLILAISYYTLGNRPAGIIGFALISINVLSFALCLYLSDYPQRVFMRGHE